MKARVLLAAWLAFGSISMLSAGAQRWRYALIMNDPSLVQHAASPRQWRTEASASYRAKIADAQQALRGELASRGFTITGSAHILVNAVFVETTPDRVNELRKLAGVKRVAYMPRVKPVLDAAVKLVNAPAAWAALGGVQDAGKGIKIAILDTGIDQNHPAFQDSSLTPPAGFPKCDGPKGSDCSFTNNKVIVADSFVSMLAAGSNPANPSADSRPDDLSPRDRVGHGTALAMVSAGETNTGPSDTITGMAPKAFLGSYKIFGTPGINDFSSGDVIIAALEKAFNDGMDIAVLSLGSPAFGSPLDNSCGGPCDPESVAVENAVSGGMVVVVAAGNEGDLGNNATGPLWTSVDSPGVAPSAITVGASTNSHTWGNYVKIAGPSVPSNLQSIFGIFSTGPLPGSVLTAPLKDVLSVSSDPQGCGALPASSLAGAIVLIQRGTCTFTVKVQNVQSAGGVGVIFYQQNSGAVADFIPDAPGTQIPSILIGNADGLGLKQLLASGQSYTAALDPNLNAIDSPPDLITVWSSRGPVLGSGGLKPDLVAVGTQLYMATQKYDPNGDLYSPSGYTVADGTSFSTPMVAGAVALVKQAHPNFTPAQLKSAVVNSAVQDLTDTDGSTPTVVEMGAGKLDTAAALNPPLTVAPATLSFGRLTGMPLPSIQLQITNTGSAAVNAALSVVPVNASAGTSVALSQSALSLAAGQSGAVTVSLSGPVPAAGSYSGNVNIQAGGTMLHVPYLYVVGDGVADNTTAIAGDGDDCTVSQPVAEGIIAVKVIDQYGVPVAGAPATFSVVSGGGLIQQPDSATDVNGIATAVAVCGPFAGTQHYRVRTGNLVTDFTGFSRVQPVIAANGAVNAASYKSGQAVAPGSYIALFGTGLSDATDAATTARLPIAIDFASVSFDVPSAGISVPGSLYYVSPNQVNVQVPWALAGQSSAQIKVTVMDSPGQVYTLPLADYSPGIFEVNGVAAAQDLNYNLITNSNPARRGQYVILYCNGLGPLDTAIATGEPAPSNPLIQTQNRPTVTIGGQPATVQFSGLAPGISGLYQLNVLVPDNAPAGLQEVIVTAGRIASNTSHLPVQ